MSRGLGGEAWGLRHFQCYRPLFKGLGPRGHLDRVPLPRGVKFKTTFITAENAFLSTSAHLTLIIALPPQEPLCFSGFGPSAAPTALLLLERKKNEPRVGESLRPRYCFSSCYVKAVGWKIPAASVRMMTVEVCFEFISVIRKQYLVYQLSMGF